MEKQKNAIGRRKEAVTRVFISKGEGKITINDRDYKEYFPLFYLQNQIEAPLKTAELLDKYDIVINAQGGGLKGQAEAAKLGVARALLEVNPELRPILKAAGYLTRDPRGLSVRSLVTKKQEKASNSQNVNIYNQSQKDFGTIFSNYQIFKSFNFLIWKIILHCNNNFLKLAYTLVT
jgi:small subunit ribosomal protein S9